MYQIGVNDDATQTENNVQVVCNNTDKNINEISLLVYREERHISAQQMTFVRSTLQNQYRSQTYQHEWYAAYIYI